MGNNCLFQAIPDNHLAPTISILKEHLKIGIQSFSNQSVNQRPRLSLCLPRMGIFERVANNFRCDWYDAFAKKRNQIFLAGMGLL